MQFRYSCVPILLVLSVVGCSPQWSRFEFRNSSQTLICVDDLSPLERPPPCGYLVPDGVAGANMARQVIPKEMQITWWVVPEEDSTEPKTIVTDIVVSNYESSTRRSDLVLEYKGNNTWDARFVEPD